MHRHIDLAEQGCRRAEPDGSLVRDLVSALAILAFWAAFAFVLMATVMPELPV